MPPCVEGGVFKQAVIVSQGTVVAEDSTTHCETSVPQPQSEEVEVAAVHAGDTEESVGEVLVCVTRAWKKSRQHLWIW